MNVCVSNVIFYGLLSDTQILFFSTSVASNAIAIKNSAFQSRCSTPALKFEIRFHSKWLSETFIICRPLIVSWINVSEWNEIRISNETQVEEGVLLSIDFNDIRFGTFHTLTCSMNIFNVFHTIHMPFIFRCAKILFLYITLSSSLFLFQLRFLYASTISAHSHKQLET